MSLSFLDGHTQQGETLQFQGFFKGEAGLLQPLSQIMAQKAVFRRVKEDSPGNEFW
jgi:hypothetical protein